MEIRLPNLAATQCRGLLVCGPVQTEDARLLKWMKRHPSLTARYGVRDATAYLHASFHEGKQHNRLHVDVLAKDFLEGVSPRVTAKVGEIQEALDHLEGQRVQADIDGYFALPEQQLPAFIRAAIVETKATDEVSIRTAGGTFVVRGAPIYAIHWFVGRNERATIHLVASRQMTIDVNYLESALELLESAFKTFVSGGKPDVRR